MDTLQHETLTTRDARVNLPKMLRLFREHGETARDFVIGSRRKPEAVVMSYARYMQLRDLELRQISEARLASAASVPVDLDDVARSLDIDPERTRI